MTSRQKRVFIHAGFPKTGTTYLQSLLSNNREKLREFDLEYPTTTRFKAHHEFAAVTSGKVMGWEDHGGFRAVKKSKTRLLRQISKSETDAIISSEYLAELENEQIQDLVNELHDYEKHVIFTVRPIAKILPSSYQQSLKNGSKKTYDKWLQRRLEEPISKSGSQYWARHNHHLVIAKWSNLIGETNTHVVISNENNPRFLPEAFFAILGVPIEAIDSEKNTKLNRSLNVEEAELVREINARFDKDRGWEEYSILIRSALIATWSSAPSMAKAQRIEIPAKYAEPVAKKAAEITAGIRALKCNIHGQIDSLSVAKIGSYEQPVQISISDVAEAISSFRTEDILNRVSFPRLVAQIAKRLLRVVQKYEEK